VKCWITSYGIEILVRYGVSPIYQFLQKFASAIVRRMQGMNFRPEIHAQTPKISADSPWMRIASVQCFDSEGTPAAMYLAALLAPP
jgi:hypothetical protein